MINSALKADITPVAILAGRGDLVKAIVKSIQEQGRSLSIVAFYGQTDEELVQDIPHIWIHFGELKKMTTFLHDQGVKEILMIGHMKRPPLSTIKPDWEVMKWLPKLAIRAKGDDQFLRSLVNMIESYGFKVIGVDDVLADLLAPEGAIGKCQPDEQAWQDIRRGVEVLRALSPVDVGQAVVVQEGLVLAVEAIEGTDAMIARAGKLQRSKNVGVVVKISKTQQERRADLPTVGPGTIEALKKAELRGLAVEAGKTIIVKRDAMVRAADDAGIFIVGLEKTLCHGAL